MTEKAKKPAARKTAAKKPAAKKPTARKTAAKKSTARKTAAKKPAAKKLPVENPAVEAAPLVKPETPLENIDIGGIEPPSVEIVVSPVESAPLEIKVASPAEPEPEIQVVVAPSAPVETASDQLRSALQGGTSRRRKAKSEMTQKVISCSCGNRVNVSRNANSFYCPQCESAQVIPADGTQMIDFMGEAVQVNSPSLNAPVKRDRSGRIIR